MEEETKIKLPAVRVGIGTLFTIVVTGASLCATMIGLYAEKRNAEIFLSRSEYIKDQVYTTQIVKDIKFSQDEMRADIKLILKEQGKK